MKLKKILSVFLSFSIIFSLFNVPVNAQGAELVTDTPVIEEVITEDSDNKEVIIEEIDTTVQKQELIKESRSILSNPQPKANSEQEEHAHVWDSEWTTDDDYHWKQCTASDCDIVENAAKKVMKNINLM